MAAEQSVRRLTELGFTELEASVYTYLVQHSPATAYRVAQGIGKAVANTYKAVESLHQKGAVLVDETGENRLCRAVPPAELLGRLRKTFERQQDAAARALARLQPAGGDDGIFALTSPGQIYERCARMLGQAEDVVLLDAFPGLVDRLRPDLETCVAREISVVVQAYTPTELAGAEVIVPRDAEGILRRWPGQWLCLVVDGAEHLFAYLDREARVVHQAIWSASAFLSWLHHSYLVGSMRDQLLEHLFESATDVGTIKATLARTDQWAAPEARGYQELRARFGESDAIG